MTISGWPSEWPSQNEHRRMTIIAVFTSPPVQLTFPRMEECCRSSMALRWTLKCITYTLIDIQQSREKPRKHNKQFAKHFLWPHASKNTSETKAFLSTDREQRPTYKQPTREKHLHARRSVTSIELWRGPPRVPNATPRRPGHAKMGRA